MCDKSLCGYKTGCIAVRGGKVLAKVWNETLAGETFCQNGVCVRETESLRSGKNIERVCSIHAEAALVGLAAAKGVPLIGCDVYVTTYPCLICSRLLVKARIGRLFYMSDYMGGNEAGRLFEAAGILVEQIPEKEVWNQR